MPTIDRRIELNAWVRARPRAFCQRVPQLTGVERVVITAIDNVFDNLTAARKTKADAYWKTTFGPLLSQNYS